MEERIYRGKWFDNGEDFYLEDCFENRYLTLFKKYKCYQHNNHIIIVISDDGYERAFNINLFYTVDEWRNIKLKELGI